MLDFLYISCKSTKKGIIEISPKFTMVPTTDLMIRGRDFYAIWNEEAQLWSTEEWMALYLIDKELDAFAEEKRKSTEDTVKVLHMWDSDSGMVDKWHKYVQKQRRDSYHPLDENIIFSNTKVKKTDYASKRLSYTIEEGKHDAYDELMSTLYSKEERHKIEWAIGSIISGDSKKTQKFMVLYGPAGTGKSTVLDIIMELFDGYYSVFDARALGSSSNEFALEAFKSNPLVAIQHDGDLSRIEDNTRLNSVVSHELMTVNEKFKSPYPNRFKCFLFMGTNKPVRITDAKSGLLRRLIDVSPTGNKVPTKRYKELIAQIKFELGAIAEHCKNVYKKNPGAYDDYIPYSMLGASNDFYNFMLDSFDVFKGEDGTTLKAAWEMYKNYCDDARVPFPLSQKIFKEELKNYFETFEERARVGEDTRVRNYYGGFIENKFEYHPVTNAIVEDNHASWLSFTQNTSKLDDILRDCPAQYGNESDTPTFKWANVKTMLKDINTSRLHYVKVPQNHIVIDFDIQDEEGIKSLERNIEEASKWPETYAELSKSGKGIHLHYDYTGDVNKLSRIFAEHVEIKVFTGNSSLRRKVSKCNNLPVSKINPGPGLPMKGDKLINNDIVVTEKGLRTLIIKNLKKEIHPGTKPSIDFIDKVLSDAYEQGVKYDLTDMQPAILSFAMDSTHQAEYCVKKVNQMKFKSDDEGEHREDTSDKPIVFFDVEVFPNLFLVNYKREGDGKPVLRMINPSPAEIEDLLNNKLIGFNCRRYDNHMLYARLMGYSNEQLYNLSQKIVNGENAFFGEAYNLSYADIYDFSSVKQSLKKFEIDLGIHHKELGLPWDQPVPEKLWTKVAEYCDNDVLATEAVFNARKQDFVARQVLASISGLTINDTTRMHATKIIFGNEKHPQLEYTDLSKMFPGYSFECGKSSYRGENPGEGGYVYSEPGMYKDVALLDVASMHPTSIIQLNLFGEYTKRFEDLKNSRILIKHGDFDGAKKMLNGALIPFLTDKDSSEDLAFALKIVINSIYGYTSAKFENPFRDIRNMDNIVAKRGALFMIDLKYEIQKRGFTVAHIKTDSIKIPNATKDIIDFVVEFGKKYGYIFEHEATYDRMCLVNDAVYIAKYSTVDKCESLYGKEYVNSSKDILKEVKKHPDTWTATGAQFQVPYVFKTLFSKEPIDFNDLTEAKSVTSSLYLDMNENLPEGEHNYIFIGKVGLFTPIKAGRGGGLLYREKDGKYYAATGTTGYRWLESEMVRNLGLENDIDYSHFSALADEAVATISEYGDFEMFANN